MHRSSLVTSSVLVWMRRLHLNIPFSILTRKDNIKLAMFLFVFDPAASHFPSVCWLQIKGNGSPMTPFRKFYLPSLPSPGPLLQNYPILAASQSVASDTNLNRPLQRRRSKPPLLHSIPRHPPFHRGNLFWPADPHTGTDWDKIHSELFFSRLRGFLLTWHWR